MRTWVFGREREKLVERLEFACVGAEPVRMSVGGRMRGDEVNQRVSRERGRSGMGVGVGVGLVGR